METVAEIVRKNESDYTNGTTKLSKYVDFSLEENIYKIEAYLNSKHISGSTDSMGREKPFFNVCTSAVNVWYRATDIDRKHILIKATKSSDVVGAFIATSHLQDWMKRDNFGKFLNEWGRTLSKYGSAVCKFITNDNGLHAEIIPWNRLIVDPIRFDNDVTIEVLELTPAQLRRRKGYDQELVEQLITATSTRKLSDGQNKDTKSNFIKLYEVHGELPLSMITDKEKDENEYVQQMQVISFVERKEKGGFDDFVLVKGKEKKHPYMITHLIEEEGRTMAIGAVENLFETQWMQNHSVKAIKDQLDLSSKLIFQTSDGNFVGQNALDAIENGDILVHAKGEPLTQVANNSHDIVSLQNFQSQWKSLGNEINGIAESMLGESPKSGTAWRQTEAILQESHSLFEIMTENKGLYIEEMMREYIIPYLKTQMNTTKEVAMTLNSYNIDKINKMYVPKEAVRRANKKKANQMFAGEIAKEPNIKEEENIIRGELENGIFFSPEDIKDKTWKEYFKDFEWDVEIDVTGEGSNTQAMMTTLNTTLSTLVGLQGRPMTPDEKLVFNKILTATGQVSPIEMSQIDQSTPQVKPTGKVEEEPPVPELITQ